MNFHLKTVSHTRIADMETPVSIYLGLRDRFAGTLLLEHAAATQEHGFSYICCDPLAGIMLEDGLLTGTYPDGTMHTEPVGANEDLVQKINSYLACFSTDRQHDKFSVDGMFGYFSYGAVRHFEQITLRNPVDAARQVPDVRLAAYRYVIVYSHFSHEITIIHFYCTEEDCTGISVIEDAIRSRHVSTYPFKTTSAEHAGCTDEDFLEKIEQGRQYCYSGDVFQIVLSRGFEVSFAGDEFNVYRALRAINPSQYLFYFDYGDYRLFGSSPECQLKIRSGKATLHPIAGTYRRNGDETVDKQLAAALLADKKEQAEHVMLVDLARNDLSKMYRKVEVLVFRRVQTYSHVLHVVSEVTGEDAAGPASPLRVLADTFPAGTLSGAPKYRAMQLIDALEESGRGCYGGCAGFTGFGNECNQAIMIRSFLSRNSTLYYRAGAGVVAASVPQSELEEVNNKIAALRAAIQTAGTI